MDSHGQPQISLCAAFGLHGLFLVLMFAQLVHSQEVFGLPLYLHWVRFKQLSSFHRLLVLRQRDE